MTMPADNRLVIQSRGCVVSGTAHPTSRRVCPLTCRFGLLRRIVRAVPHSGCRLPLSGSYPSTQAIVWLLCCCLSGSSNRSFSGLCAAFYSACSSTLIWPCRALLIRHLSRDSDRPRDPNVCPSTFSAQIQPSFYSASRKTQHSSHWLLSSFSIILERKRS
jgi:hypothetical protein